MTQIFTVADRALIASATQDYAADYYGERGPFTFVADDAARYVSEGHLRVLVSRYGLGPVWDAVAEHIAAHPHVLTLTRHQRAELQRQRQDAARDLISAAAQSFKTGDYDRALSLLDDAEVADPSRNVDGYRDRVVAAAAKEAGAMTNQNCAWCGKTHDNPVLIDLYNLGVVARAMGPDAFGATCEQINQWLASWLPS